MMNTRSRTEQATAKAMNMIKEAKLFRNQDHQSSTSSTESDQMSQDQTSPDPTSPAPMNSDPMPPANEPRANAAGLTDYFAKLNINTEEEETEKSTETDTMKEIRHFMKQMMLKQQKLFKEQLDEATKQHQRQLAQLKQQLSQQWQQQMIQLTSTLQPTITVQTETISKNTPKTKEKNRKQTPASVKRKITNNDPPTPPTQKNTLYPPPADYNSPPNSRKNIDAVVLGDSIIKHVKGRSAKISSGKFLKVCSYPGAGTEKIADHAEVELKHWKTNTAIIHAGTNDLFAGTRGDNIADTIAYLGLELKDRGVKNIGISGMTPVQGQKWEILNLNHCLRLMCKAYKFDFIDNTNIIFQNHVSRDGTHLNYDGVDILTGNYARYLRDVRPRYGE